MEAPLFYFQCLEAKKEINGRFTQTLDLVKPDGLSELYLLFREGDSPALWGLEPGPGPFKITGSRRNRVNLYAFGRVKTRGREKILTAAASFFLWGDSKIPSPREPAPPAAVSAMAGLPFVGLVPEKGSYWTQAGQPFRFRLETGDPVKELLAAPQFRVFERPGKTLPPANPPPLRRSISRPMIRT